MLNEMIFFDNENFVIKENLSCTQIAVICVR